MMFFPNEISCRMGLTIFGFQDERGLEGSPHICCSIYSFRYVRVPKDKV
jgi:hypothetical protein